MKHENESKETCREEARTLRAVQLRLSDDLSPGATRTLKTHLASCAFCAAQARAADPTLLFVPLSAAASLGPPADEARRVAQDVLAEVRRRSRVSSPASPRRFGSRRFLQVAALVVLAAGLGLGGLRLLRREPAATPASAVVAQGPAEARLAREAARRSVRPLIQDLKCPGARVYEFAADSPREPSVVFIADPHADL